MSDQVKHFKHRGLQVAITTMFCNRIWYWWYVIENSGAHVAVLEEGHDSEEGAVTAATIDAKLRIESLAEVGLSQAQCWRPYLHPPAPTDHFAVGGRHALTGLRTGRLQLEASRETATSRKL